MRFVLPMLVLITAAASLPGCDEGREDAPDNTLDQENFEWLCGTSPEFAVCRCYLTDPTDPKAPEPSTWGPPVDICPAFKDCCVTYKDVSGYMTCACLESTYYDGVCAPPKTPPESVIVPSCPPPG